MSKTKNSGKPKQKPKTKKTRTMSVPIRLEVKPDGRVVWDVAEVHKAIAKAAAMDPFFANCKELVKKDATALKFDAIRSKAKTVEDTEPEVPVDTQDVNPNSIGADEAAATEQS